MNLIMLVIGIFFLVKGADIFIDGCSNFSKWLKVPSIIIGLTVVAFGTSLPEASVSLIASISGENSISVGNVVGSNLCNILLVLGFSSLFGHLSIKKNVLYRDYIYYLIASLLLFVMICKPFFHGFNVSMLSKISGLILLLCLIIYLITLLKSELNSSNLEYEHADFKISYILYIILGLVGIIIGGNLVVDSAENIARILNVSENVIALTIVAIGTSLPELVTSILATKKGEIDIAIGNVIGSNIFNILFILGISSLFGNLTISYESFLDIIWMIIVSIIVFITLIKKMGLRKKNGIMFLVIYLVYLIYILNR